MLLEKLDRIRRTAPILENYINRVSSIDNVVHLIIVWDPQHVFRTQFSIQIGYGGDQKVFEKIRRQQYHRLCTSYFAPLPPEKGLGMSPFVARTPPLGPGTMLWCSRPRYRTNRGF